VTVDPTDPLPWHRLLGVVLQDFLAGSAWAVEIARDLAVQQQRLDLLVRHRGEGPDPPLWPDGLDGPARHFLLTFKSLREALDVKAIQELVGHFVAYQKRVSPRPGRLLPDDRFRMVAATMRFPRDLAAAVPLQPRRAGVYDRENPVAPVRVLVLRELPATAANVVWNLFSGQAELVRQAQERLRPRLTTLTTALNRLFEFYQLEGEPMPYTMEDFIREETERLVKNLTPQQLAQLRPEQVAQLRPEQVAQLRPEQLARLTPEQRLAGLTPEERQALRKLLDETPSAN
jgi:hypothetical protein